jgi:hypothetical protein
MREELAAKIASDIILAAIDKNLLALHLSKPIKDQIATKEDLSNYNQEVIEQIHKAYKEAYFSILKTID